MKTPMNRRDFVRAGIISAGVFPFLNSCQIVEQGAAVALQLGGLTDEQAGSIIRSSKAIAKTFEDFTPEQEYYIGRSVAAHIFSRYSPYLNDKRLEYVNLVGNSLALSSDIPETFGGYHFALLNSSDINAFAAPGGFVFVTLGMLRCCPHEDALAAVLAHEIAHVQLKHGLEAIKASRVTEAVTVLISEAGRTIAGEQLDKLVENFGGSISDITGTMINNGYSRSSEEEADQLALQIMHKAGYSSQGMSDMLALMQKRLKPGGSDFFKTHPSPENRLDELQAELKNGAAIPAFRRARLLANMGQI